MLGITTRSRPHEETLEVFGPAIALSYTPFVISFLAVFAFAWRTLFPLLSGQTATAGAGNSHARRRALRLYQIPRILKSWTLSLLERAPAITFSTTIALSAVLAELIFCEIANVLNPVAREVALQITISVLLVSLVIVTPALEIHSITSAAGWKISGLTRGTRALAWILDVLGLVAWLAAFWWLGQAVLGNHYSPQSKSDLQPSQHHGLGEESLERIGIIGIGLTATIAGVGASSSLYQTFGARHSRIISDADVTRKQAGLEATASLVSAKETRLSILEQKMATLRGKDQGYMTRIVGTIKGNPEANELLSLRNEVKGLKWMESSSLKALQSMRNRREVQKQAQTPLGRAFIVASYVFSLYCLYKIAATSVATFRRWWHPSRSGSTTDPITNVLSLVAEHWEPELDRAAWSRQISFLLSGLMLLASFNAVLQTVLLFSRFTPARILQSAQQNLALLVSQISATYVVSSALLLRNNLPREMGSVIETALGAPLDTAFAERWFEGWFLGACGVTAVGIWIGKSVLGTSDWEEDVEEVDIELGKRS